MIRPGRFVASGVLSPLLLAVVTVATFFPVLEHALLNWDDPDVLLRNPHLRAPGVVEWAFTTRYVEHYQPLSWLTWAGLTAWVGQGPRLLHAVSLAAHLVAALLVSVVFLRLARLATRQAGGAAPWIAACVAALVFGVHPLRVEVVAWASALPYTLALTAVLASVLAYLRATGRIAWAVDVAANRDTPVPQRRTTTVVPPPKTGALVQRQDVPDARWLTLALTLYALSLLARPVALGYPFVLLVLDAWPLRRPLGRRLLLEKVPFLIPALAAATAESWARAPAVADLPLAVTVRNALTAPLVYVWRTLVPAHLTPLELLPPGPRAGPVGVAATVLTLAAATVLLWRLRRRWPAQIAAWLAYLALLAPAAGLIATGQQLTADRHTYVPGVPFAMLAGAGVLGAWETDAARSPRQAGASTAAALRRWLVVGLAVVALAWSVTATRAYLRHWADSISLWTRVLAVEPANEVALYNLGEALAASGWRDEAVARYRQLLALRPDHEAGRRNLDLLEAERLEAEGNARASRGDMRGAAEAYRLAVALDARRTHAHAALGMARLALGDADAAVASLQEAVRQGIDDPAVPNALALELRDRGDAVGARRVLESALARYPDSVDLAHNLARLLALGDDPSVRDPATALQLATAVVKRTGEDPRALDTLAAAYAANGRLGDAREALARAEQAARRRGNGDLADTIGSRRRALRRVPERR